jgi:hypothetical protein
MMDAVLRPAAITDTVGLSLSVRAIENEHDKANTRLTYDCKTEEFRAYCRHKYPTERDGRYTVMPEKVQEFLYYQAFREKCRKRRRNEDESGDASAAQEEGFDRAWIL